MATYGYAGKVLRVDLTSGTTTEIPTAEYSDRFLGGRGIAAKIYWDEVKPSADAYDEGNTVIFATGPLGGLPVLGGSRWQVCGKSPTTPEHFSYGSFGGRWGAKLKFAGYDAIMVRGKSERPVYLWIDAENVEVRDASWLWGKGAAETRRTLKNELGNSNAVVAIGQAGENLSMIANLLADDDATGSAGLGAVMGSKKLKAVVVRNIKRNVKVAQPERLQNLMGVIRDLKQTRKRVLDGVDVLEQGPNIKPSPCYGCLGRCVRTTYETQDGTKGKFMCSSAGFYRYYAQRYYGEDSDIPFLANRLCDDYGLDALAIDANITWLRKCYEAGILTDKHTGIPISKLGSIEFIETLVRKLSTREGFGEVLADGLEKAAEQVGQKSKALLPTFLFKGDQPVRYSPRLYNTHALLYATEPRLPIQQLHEISHSVGKWLNWLKDVDGGYLSTEVLSTIARRFWGSESAADFSTIEGKALAAVKIQNRQYAKECLGLCDFMWPVLDIEPSDDHVGLPGLESEIFSAVSGLEIDETGLNEVGERVFNLQRAILIREGHNGRESDVLPPPWHTTPLSYDPLNNQCLVPGKGTAVLSRKGAVTDWEEFEQMKGEYYEIRHWDAKTGIQTREALQALQLADVADELDRRGLTASST